MLASGQHYYFNLFHYPLWKIKKLFQRCNIALLAIVRWATAPCARPSVFNSVHSKHNLTKLKIFRSCFLNRSRVWNLFYFFAHTLRSIYKTTDEPLAIRVLVRRFFLGMGLCCTLLQCKNNGKGSVLCVFFSIRVQTFLYLCGIPPHPVAHATNKIGYIT